MARDFNTDGAAGAFESDGGPPSTSGGGAGAPTPPVMTDPGPGGASSVNTAAPAAGGAIEYSAPGAQGPVGTRTISDTGSGLTLNGVANKPLPAWYTAGGGGLQQNTGGMQMQMMFEDGGMVGGGNDGEGNPKGVDWQDILHEALGTIDNTFQYARKQYGLSDGGQAPQGGQGQSGQGQPEQPLPPNWSGGKDFGAMNQAQPGQIEDRREIDPTKGSDEGSGQGFMDHIGRSNQAIGDKWNIATTMFNPMSKDLGRDDISNNGPLPDPTPTQDQPQQDQPQQDQPQYGIPTDDDIEGRY